MLRRDQIILAVISALLTLNLTASTSFITRKDSSVLSSSFVAGDDAKSRAQAPGTAGRKVLYYVCDPCFRLDIALTVLFQAAGSGIPEIKTILSGMWRVPVNCFTQFTQDMVRFCYSRIPWRTYSVYEGGRAGTLRRFRALTRYAHI